MLDEKDLEMLRAMMTQTVCDSESRMMVYIESGILPRFDVLAYGHKLLKEPLAPQSRVDELEEVAFLKPLVMSMLTDIDKRKKAQ